jgi:pimeloyl-ACP methyl ester carboxylesterase
MRAWRSEEVTLNGLRHHVRIWPGENAASRQLMLLHGMGDACATWEPLAELLPREWELVAPDWRGHGRSAWGPGSWYPMATYIADLDALVRRYSASRPVALAGHSLGAVVAGYYAGIRPANVSALALLDPYPNVHRTSADTPQRYAQWLDALAAPARVATAASLDEFAQGLQSRHPGLGLAEARRLAAVRCEEGDGRVRVRMDPARRTRDPAAWAFEDAAACWRAVTAPVLWVRAGAPARADRTLDEHLLRDVGSQFRTLHEHVLPGAGHLVHWERAQDCAALMTAHFRGEAPARPPTTT